MSPHFPFPPVKTLFRRIRLELARARARRILRRAWADLPGLRIVPDNARPPLSAYMRRIGEALLRSDNTPPPSPQLRLVTSNDHKDPHHASTASPPWRGLKNSPAADTEADTATGTESFATYPRPTRSQQRRSGRRA